MAVDPLKQTIENAKKLKLSYLDALPPLLALASGQGVLKASWEGIKWGAISAALPVASQLALLFFGLGSAVKGVVEGTGSLEAAINRIGQMQGLEKVFSGILGGVNQAKRRVAELIDFSNKTPFSLKESAEASRSLQLLAPELATPQGLQKAGDVAAGTGQPIADVAQGIGSFQRKLSLGGDISADLEQLRQLGIVSDQTARQVMALQAAGVGFSQIWSKVDEDLNRFTGSMASMRDEIGNVQSHFEKAQENLAAAFGQPFVEAHIAGIQRYTKAIQNITPAVSQVAKTFSQVTGVTSAFKSKTAEVITSIPGLDKAASFVSKAAVAGVGALGVVGAEAFRKNIPVLKGLLGSVRDLVADQAIVHQARMYVQSRAIVADPAAMLKSGQDKIAEAERLKASVQARMARGPSFRAGGEGLLRRAEQMESSGRSTVFRSKILSTVADTGSIAQGAKTVAGEGLKKFGSFLIKPTTIATGGIIAATAALWDLYQAHKQNTEAALAFAKANREVLNTLDQQIVSIVTLNDKQRALAATANAIAEAKSKAVEGGLPISQNEASLSQKLVNPLVKANNAVAGFLDRHPLLRTAADTANVFTGSQLGQKGEAELSPGQVEQRAAQKQLTELHQRQQALEKIPDQDLLTEEHLGRTSERTIKERQLEELEVQTRLHNAPTAAAREVIFKEQEAKFGERVRSGESEVQGHEDAESRATKLRDQETIAKGGVVAATKGLDALAIENKATRDRADVAEKEIQKRIDSGAHGRRGGTITREEAEQEVDLRRIDALQRELDSPGRKRADQLQKNTTGVANPQTERDQAELDLLKQRTSERTQLMGGIGSNAEKGIKEQIDEIFEHSKSELDRIDQVFKTLGEGREAKLDDGTGNQRIIGRGDIDALQARRTTLRENLSTVEQQREAQRQATAQAEQEAIQKRTEAPDIEAEQKLLGLRSEGMEREEAVAAITAQRNGEALAVARQLFDEENKRLEAAGKPQIPEAEFQKSAPVRQAAQSDDQLRREANQRVIQKQQLEFSRRSLAVEATTGEGPDEAIRSLKEQLTITEDQIVATKQLHEEHLIDANEEKQQMVRLAAQHNEQRQKLDEITTQRNEQLEAARSETTQLGYSVTGQDALAQLEATRLSYAQKIAAAIKDQNSELANQLRTQRNLSLAAQLGALLSRSPKEIKDDQDRKREESRRLHLGQAAMAEARDRIARGVKLDASDPMLGFFQAEDEQKAKEAKQQVEAQQAERERIAHETGIKDSSETLGVTPTVGEHGVKTPAEIELETKAREHKAAEIVTAGEQSTATTQQKAEAHKEITIEAAPFKEALDSSEVLQKIRDNTAKPATATTTSPKESPATTPATTTQPTQQTQPTASTESAGATPGAIIETLQKEIAERSSVLSLKKEALKESNESIARHESITPTASSKASYDQVTQQLTSEHRALTESIDHETSQIEVAHSQIEKLRTTVTTGAEASPVPTPVASVASHTESQVGSVSSTGSPVSAPPLTPGETLAPTPPSSQTSHTSTADSQSHTLAPVPSSSGAVPSESRTLLTPIGSQESAQPPVQGAASVPPASSGPSTSPLAPGSPSSPVGSTLQTLPPAATVSSRPPPSSEPTITIPQGQPPKESEESVRSKISSIEKEMRSAPSLDRFREIEKQQTELVKQIAPNETTEKAYLGARTANKGLDKVAEQVRTAHPGATRIEVAETPEFRKAFKEASPAFDAATKERYGASITAAQYEKSRDAATQATSPKAASTVATTPQTPAQQSEQQATRQPPSSESPPLVSSTTPTSGETTQKSVQQPPAQARTETPKAQTAPLPLVEQGSVQSQSITQSQPSAETQSAQYSSSPPLEITPESVKEYKGVPVRQAELADDRRAEFDKASGDILLEPKKIREFQTMAKGLSDKGLDWRTKELGGKPGTHLSGQEITQSKAITSSVSNFTRYTLEHELLHKEHPDWKHPQIEREAWKRTAAAVKEETQTAKSQPTSKPPAPTTSTEAAPPLVVQQESRPYSEPRTVSTQAETAPSQTQETPPTETSQTKVTGVTFSAPVPQGINPDTQPQPPLLKSISENPDLYPEFKRVFKGKEPTAETLSGINLNSLSLPKMSSELMDALRHGQQQAIGRPSPGTTTRLGTVAESGQTRSGSALGGATPPGRTALGPGMHAGGIDDVMGPQGGHMGEPTHMAPLGTGEGGRPETAEEREAKRTAKEQAVRERNARDIKTPAMVEQEAWDNASHHAQYAPKKEPAKPQYEIGPDGQPRLKAGQNLEQDSHGMPVVKSKTLTPDQAREIQSQKSSLEATPPANADKYRTPQDKAEDELHQKLFSGLRQAAGMPEPDPIQALWNARSPETEPSALKEVEKAPKQGAPSLRGEIPTISTERKEYVTKPTIGDMMPPGGSAQQDPWMSWRLGLGQQSSISPLPGLPGQPGKDGSEPQNLIDKFRERGPFDQQDQADPASPIALPDLAAPAGGAGGGGGGGGGDNGQILTVLNEIKTSIDNLVQQVGTA